MLRAGALVFLFLAGCASAPPPEEAPPPLSTPVVGEAPAENKKVSVDEIAASLPDDHACAQKVEILRNKNPRGAFALMTACIKQEKYRNLRRVTELPFVESFRKLSPLARDRLLAHLIAIRGADFEGDLPRLAAVNLPLLTLRELIDNRNQRGPKNVVFRGLIEGRKTDANGTTQFTIAELRRQTQDIMTADVRLAQTSKGVVVTGISNVRKRGSMDEFVPSGWTLQAQLADPPPTLQEGESLVFLARFDGADDNQQTVRISIIDAFKAGVRMADY